MSINKHATELTVLNICRENKIVVTNKHRPWFGRGLFFGNAYFSISVGLYSKSFGIMLKKNGNSLDLDISLFLTYFSLTLWDRGLRKIFLDFKK